jgi:hypothetical protein
MFDVHMAHPPVANEIRIALATPMPSGRASQGYGIKMRRIRPGPLPSCLARDNDFTHYSPVSELVSTG